MIGKWFSMSAAAFLLLLPAAVCAQAPEPAQAVSQPSPAWEKLVKAAQQEGRVEVVIAGQAVQKLRPAMGTFEKKYGIKVNFQTGGGGAHAERILAERRSGRYTVDVWIGGANTALVSLIPNKALASIPELLIDPGVTDPSLWFQGKHHYTDPDGRYIFTYAASPAHIIAFNTKMVNPAEIKSIWDLLDPKWKGKIVSWSPGDQGTASTSVSLLLMPKIGEEWFRRWANEMDVTIVKDARQGAEWVALGRFPIGMFGLSTQADWLAGEGFPIQGYLPQPFAEGEALTASASNIMVMEKAPNPNAAQLFVNWALSQEGQSLFIRLGEKRDSLRTDVPNDVIELQHRIRPDREYFVSFTNPDYVNRQGELIETLRRIMKEAGYK
jgi:iron(III) transport system substrate-binding protein